MLRMFVLCLSDLQKLYYYYYIFFRFILFLFFWKKGQGATRAALESRLRLRSRGFPTPELRGWCVCVWNTVVIWGDLSFPYGSFNATRNYRIPAQSNGMTSHWRALLTYCLSVSLSLSLPLSPSLSLNKIKQSKSKQYNRSLQHDVIPLDGTVSRVSTVSSCIETAIGKT